TTNPTAVTVPTSTTARLYADALDDGDVFLGVQCSTTAVEDLAGNLMVIPVYIYGFGVEKAGMIR
ncbi:unnamed protein product, partial [marine sediment metagenome]